ncbi:Ppx/GppA phosphatase family protein [Actinomyces sp. W5033]|uniref:Ppx/GppA phosphatase family protein n=1 Tax=Actinomyces sp. W5033 TaxID=3446479 RepID=UPI003EDFAACD
MRYLVDLGSSSVKVYEVRGDGPRLVSVRTLDFKSEFSPAEGITETKYLGLLNYIEALRQDGLRLVKSNSKVFATGVFREVLARQALVEKFYADTGLFLNIISHDLEQFYLEGALAGLARSNRPLLGINIGGRTTELVFYSELSVRERVPLDVGVGTVLKDFPGLNDAHSAHPLDSVVSQLKSSLPLPSGEAPAIALYTGGELNYMRLANYGLVPNAIFSDDAHPSMITLPQYVADNRRVFSQVTMDDLRSKMPSNPDWMNGARACSALAQAICEHYGVNLIVPSDWNLIDGVVYQEARSVVLCGSFNRHLEEIGRLADRLRAVGIRVLSPVSTRVVGEVNGFVLFEGDSMVNRCTWSVESHHLKAIEAADMVVVCNFDDYVGSKTALEIGYAYKLGKRLVFLKDGPSVADFDVPSEVGLVGSIQDVTG